ncbi:MAG TPA: 5-oxoprolinase subunit PxpA [Thermoflexales bacterium]|nr:5-oxoprolinase subunit PxpA [Thermoflexales bacterium]HQW35033.1 5-oxoprolinase subunit PxpA [Thermoflexales bacterium]HQZ23104.1 5-oxoprolinase subunit PxpA [Thermoflexales bacterium]HQZ99781.1 5-oxoprolinase subunit PxpA [Thermoflexales bacterium]
MTTIDLNADCGEGIGNDADILPHVTSANIACGGHAGDEVTMRETLRMCAAFHVAPGAHPSFHDRTHFGRRILNVPAAEIERDMREQILALRGIAQTLHLELAHVKPHGALYNVAAEEPGIAAAIARAVKQIDPALILVGLAGSQLIEAGRAAGLRVAAEAFADRVYEANGTLRSRSLPGAMIEDDERSLEQALSIIQHHAATAFDGSRIAIHADTICLHSDTPGAAHRATYLQQALKKAGVRIRQLKN